MPFAVQADAIRVALLNKYGGVWIDTDTIILNGEFIKDCKNYELTIIRDTNSSYFYIGFIFASKYSSLLNEWIKDIIYRVKIYKLYLLDKKNNIWEKMKNNFNSVRYLGNDIFNFLIKNKTFKTNELSHLDSDKINAFPERKSYNDHTLKFCIKQYKNFYFTKGDPKIVLNNSKSIILLHNSWTPSKYKNMTEDEFLKQDILLSKLLDQILKL